MALADIQDILTGFPGWVTLTLSGGDQTSGQGSGIIRVKELRPALWTLTAKSVQLFPNAIRLWTAKLEGLDNGKSKFFGYDFAAVYPILYPRGTWPTGGSFDGASAAIKAMPDGKTMQMKSLPTGYKGSVGDMIKATRTSDGVDCLYRVMEAFTADGSGNTGSFEVRPAIRTGQAVDDVVAVTRAGCAMTLIPGSIQKPDGDAMGVITFQAQQAE